MRRTRAEALALVNWKGVFYERYLLDRHVTALEGANGAGKTTVMIAAYVVLLPDMSRLRFTNLGETGATGGDKGIWGRLGESGRPSYAILDFALAGQRRLIAGVHLVRKGEPSVEPIPFIVSGLGEDVRLQDLLLLTQGESEAVPEIDELRENAARLGGRLQVFSSARDYFAALFDEGVTPLRLGTDEERNKLNEMLRTSMTGGISRALTSELRGFLLKEETGLADTLQRMRANLDACRRTRIEVQESRRLEQEIGGIFEAGQAMFAAAFHATSERADELTRRVKEAEEALEKAQADLAQLESALEKTKNQLSSADTRKGELEQSFELAKERHARVREAVAANEELSRCTAALASATEEAAATAIEKEKAEGQRKRRREELGRAQENFKRAATGLAKTQQGIEELHIRAGRYQQAVRRLHQAEEGLSVSPISIDLFDELLDQSKRVLSDVDRERREAGTRLADADDHRRRYAEVIAALESLVSSEVLPEQAYEMAFQALRQHREREALVLRLPEIERELVATRKLASRQSRARVQAEQLGIALSNEVQALLETAEAERAERQEQERQAASEVANAKGALAELETRIGELSAREPEWQEHRERATRLGEHLGYPVVDRKSLDDARTMLSNQLTAARQRERFLRDEQERLFDESSELLAPGGPFPKELLRLQDQLGADLVAASFDAVPIHEASVLEARLGPLVHALVVDDPRTAARDVAERSHELPEVRLVSREADLERLTSLSAETKAGALDVLVDEGPALRISRIPKRPRLGRLAREARAKELHADAEARGEELAVALAYQRKLERLDSEREALLGGQTLWLAGDPAIEIDGLQKRRSEVRSHLESHREVRERHQEAVRLLNPRIQALRALLTEAFLLDPPDYAARLLSLETEHQAARSAKSLVTTQASKVNLIEREHSVLKASPLSDGDLFRLRLRVNELKDEREKLDAGIEALEYVRANVEALGWEDAPKRLAAKQALAPALEAQLQESETEQQNAERAHRDSETRLDKVTEVFNAKNASLSVAKKEHASAKERFEGFEIPAPSENDVRVAQVEAARLEDELKDQSKRRDELLKAEGQEERACDEARKQLHSANEKLAGERREAEPTVARWERLREQAKHHDLLNGLLAPSSVRGHVNLVQEANTRRATLLERLQHAQGGPKLLAELEQSSLRDGSEATFADSYFQTWLKVRDWLRRRLPAQIAEVDDPREALLRLSDQLSSLEERLARQESDLRGESEHVARGIDVQIRKASGQIRRLNANLEGVSFGSIRGIRVRLNRVERMDQVLRALREGAAQALLFQTDMPIEEALDEIFRRYAGGRTGGQRLLDYREYVQLQVEIRRQSGSDWELANPTRVSTGEAIGIGAALMMVVLTEWERQATLLRGKKSQGSLRFLFLDEANRLSHDNLGVLFDLCQNLELQLLIAAPEVARAEGNTTYRLVRRMTSEGHEEVLVSGRRMRVEA